MKMTILLSVVLIAFLWPNFVLADIIYEVIDLGTLGGDESEARSINDASQIVGRADGRATLFDLTGTGNNIDLGTLWKYESYAFSINDAGQIVGRALDLLTCWRATLFDPTGAGNNFDLGTLGGDRSHAYSINDANQVVGLAQNSQGYWHATLFDSNNPNNNLDLGTLGGSSSVARSINDAGQIVGCAYNDYGQWRASLFDPTGAGNNIDLNTIIDPPIGWTLMYAYDINNSGWIVGQGLVGGGGPRRNAQGEYHAFLLVPKPPCLYTLAGDLNDDCKVDFYDFAIMAANWLVDCWIEPTDPACVPK